MRTQELDLTAADGKRIAAYLWTPEKAPKAVVQIVHGMAEHAKRYAPLAQVLTGAGYAVIAHDQRGHGRTMADPGEQGHFADRDGWRLVLEDVELVRRRAVEAFPGLPMCLLGHSMGSSVAQSYVAAHPGAHQALVLSGASESGGPLVTAGLIVAKLERMRQGARGRSPIVAAMSFGTWNKTVSPRRTEFDWLSRDPAVVDAYIADPLCGFRCTNQLWIDLLGAVSRASTPEALAAWPKALPIYVIAGSRDPVSRATSALVTLLEKYREAGLTDVTHEFYPDARHEVFNETNRNEVAAKLVAWLDSHVAAPAKVRGAGARS